MEGKIRLSGGENVCRVDRDVCRVHREKPDRETKLKKTNPKDVN